jgi:hypothetical protein
LVIILFDGLESGPATRLRRVTGPDQIERGAIDMADAITPEIVPARKLLTQETLKEILHYDTVTGIFTWLERKDACQWNSRYAGKTAGSPNDRYVRMNIRGRIYYGHQLAWLYMTGEFAIPGVDHEDTDTLNNRWSNLRLATKSQNGANRGMAASNKSGFKGVIWDKARGKWKAQIGSKGKRRSAHIGRFDTPEEAHAAYCEVARELHGEFVRTE